ncbi:hypothetical protein [Paenibacillus sp. MER 99-2]|uniref:hypothetical protein n=1 Tax=Paenibacillus sp. MER 99-2 TaxID=2939572 RepID=UPI00203FD76B|nr:hypothetical protein [Paenibacillus sp. MER 99-2]MCM3170973.1 hypothetical protein [Paenibacillus sp. MER 99-2]
MLNIKKVNLAYKRYQQNFETGTKFERIKARYLNNKKEVMELSELNDKERDHILLINVGSVISYYLSIWKNDVLISQNNRVEALKQMQIAVYQQCMAQDIYKVRYPQMMTEYRFREVVMTLIHFTMFGWNREENILFEFIVEQFGGSILEVEESNKHTWFLLELYLKYRNKELWESNHNLSKTVKEKCLKAKVKNDLIPDDLEVYNEVLTNWETKELSVIKSLVNEMVEYHSILASGLGESLEFGDFRYAFYPYEILFLLHVRKKQGLPNPEHFDDFLMNTPEAKMNIQDPEPYPELDPLLIMVDEFYRKNYPEYIPNQHGELFQ